MTANFHDLQAKDLEGGWPSSYPVDMSTATPSRTARSCCRTAPQRTCPHRFIAMNVPESPNIDQTSANVSPVVPWMCGDCGAYADLVARQGLSADTFARGLGCASFSSRSFWPEVLYLIAMNGSSNALVPITCALWLTFQFPFLIHPGLALLNLKASSV